MTAPEPESGRDIAEQAAAEVISANGLDPEPEGYPLTALGWEMGDSITYENAMHQLVQRVLTIVGAEHLVAERLAQLRATIPEDIVHMDTVGEEIAWLERLQKSVAEMLPEKQDS